MGRLLGDVPALLTRGAALVEQLDAITRNGLVLAPQTVAEIGRAEARRSRWTAAALWVIAALVALLLLL
jgi:ubiquinone biosynthesis protein